MKISFIIAIKQSPVVMFMYVIAGLYDVSVIEKVTYM